MPRPRLTRRETLNPLGHLAYAGRKVNAAGPDFHDSWANRGKRLDIFAAFVDYPLAICGEGLEVAATMQYDCLFCIASVLLADRVPPRRSP